MLPLFLCALAAGPADVPKGPVPLLLQKPTLSKASIVFAYADDLWIVPREGGEAKRLTNGAGVETDPVFSPDGKMVAFTGQYDGNDDVFVVPAAGGQPQRLTYHPGVDQAVGWTRDGKRVLFRSGREAYSRLTRLYTIGLSGGEPEALPLPRGDHGSYSPDGKSLAYVPFVNSRNSAGSYAAWKRYRGGRAPAVWLADLSDSSIVKVPRKDSNDTCPMWIEGRVYFLSDRDGPVTLYVYDPGTKEVKRLIDNKDQMDIRTASAGPDAIVYEKPGALFVYDLNEGKSTEVKVSIKADLPALRTRIAKVEPLIRSATVSPTGARVAFEARGDIFTVPAAKGDARNLTRTTGVAERDPAWSPDGQSIAYFTDESGEYELRIARPNAAGKVVKTIKPGDGPSFYYSPVWSPDGKRIAYSDKRLNLWQVEVESGKSTKIDQNPYPDIGRLVGNWSPDSKWLTYTKQLKSHLFAVFVHDVASGKSTQLTDGSADTDSAVFDKGGKYIYFTASTDVGLSRAPLMSTIHMPQTRSAYLIVLDADTPSPLAPESDEEKEAAKKGEAPKEKKPEAGDKSAPKAEKPKADAVKIDFDGIDQRILALPVRARNYVGLMAGKPGTLYLAEGPEVVRYAGPPQASALFRFTLATRKTEPVVSGISYASLSENGEKLLYRQGQKWFLTAAAAVAPGAGALNLDGVEMRIDPRAEWRQMYEEVWRLQRDFMYDPKLHGLDLPAMRKKYAAFLPGIASRNDLNCLFDEMLGNLCLGHVYIGGGDTYRATGARGGLLGCDFEAKDGRYRIKRVYRGENYNPSLRAPLTQPGNRVKEGEYLLAVDGVDLKGEESVYKLLEGTAGRTITLKVGPTADGKGSREVQVTPIPNEQPLRHLAWVEDNRKKVEKLTSGRVAYMYIPNTHAEGQARFVREFYAQVGKDGAILDERYNGGGWLADQIVDHCIREVRNYIAGRDGDDVVIPRGIFGPKVMLINEAAGSGGDYMPYTFREAKAGKLVGTRTWGGLVGIGGYPTLIDGGSVTAPHWALWFTNGKWDVENHGVSPDIEVDLDPKSWKEGRDPQLEKAVEIVMDELKKNPAKKPKRPAYPDYFKGGKVPGTTGE
ncbi:MAG: PDZ domain-containing protein [Gemmataceae bacterium]|nr:PDZ domain-containing protein [Gemmataceae bacterium]